MKKILVVLIIAAGLASCHSSKKACCDQSASKPQAMVLTSFKDTVSYMIGTDIAKSFSQNKIDINLDLLFEGIKAGYNGTDSLFTQQQFQEVMGRFQKEMQQKQQIEATKEATLNKEKGKAYMEANAKKEGVMQTASGLQYKILRDATGPKPTATNTVKVNYEGRLLDGTIFDSSYERGEPIEFGLGQVIKGWTEGLQLMSVGSMYELTIPSDLGYGDRPMQTIPAGSTLIFKVELLDFK
ncbi:MAG TPA: FKBP-type peptidyl-prolyl cis-trans isomerase [Bacteroidales bacterium]|nr:FKBP-type peptidyl-prolyl cis-trans isomerase [Bacteroidales bacterium]